MKTSEELTKKGLKIIESCVTLDQCDTATKWIFLANKYLSKDDNIFLNDKLFQKYCAILRGI